MKYYEVFPHTADLGFKVFGKTKEQLFENSCKALFDILVDIKSISESLEKEVNIKADNIEDLLFNTLDEFLFIFNVEKIIFKDFLVKFVSDGEVDIKAKGERLSIKHYIKREIKAITYHDFRVYKGRNNWYANVVIDI